MCFFPSPEWNRTVYENQKTQTYNKNKTKKSPMPPEMTTSYLGDLCRSQKNDVILQDILTCQAITLCTHPVHMNVRYVKGVSWGGTLCRIGMSALPGSHSSWGDEAGKTWEGEMNTSIAQCDNIWARWSLHEKVQEEKAGVSGRHRGKNTWAGTAEIWWSIKTWLLKWMRSLRWGQHRKLTPVNALPSVW